MEKLAAEGFLAGANDELANRLAFYLGEVNAIHPFREGNGRTQRAFVRQLAWRNGYLLSFADVTDEEMAVASLESFNGDNTSQGRVPDTRRLHASWPTAYLRHFPPQGF